MKGKVLGDYIQLAYGKSLPETVRCHGEYFVYGSSGQVGTHNRALVSGPGIVVGRKGNVGSVFWSDFDFYPIDTVYTVILKDTSLNLKYLFYLLKNLPLTQMNGDGAVPGLKREQALSLEVDIVDTTIQTRIASILSAYDDLIENNRRRIELLEESARQLYREWFIRLRFPGHENTRISDGIPEGWQKKTLGEVCLEIREIVHPETLEPETPYIGLEHMPRRSITLNQWGMAEQVSSSKHRFYQGDIIFGKIRPYFHKVGIALVDGVASSDAIIIRPTEPEFLSLVLMITSSDPFVAATAQAMKEGSKMPRADWKQMQNYPVLQPSEGLLNIFNNTTMPIYEQLKNLSLSNHKLIEARNLLLPKLMKGEIIV